MSHVTLAQGAVEGHVQAVEGALADIQLFGSTEQMSLAKKFSDEIERGFYTDPRLLLAALRQDLRQSLALDPAKQEIFHFRIEGDVPKRLSSE